MANQFRAGVSQATIPAPTPAQYARPSNLLSLGVFLCPLIFAWFIFWRPYSPTRKRLTGVWMCLVLIVMLNSLTPAHDDPMDVFRRPPWSAASMSQMSDGWTYTSRDDAMRGTSRPIAMVFSSNAVELSAPYQGGSKVRLALQKNSAVRGDNYDGRLSGNYDGR